MIRLEGLSAGAALGLPLVPSLLYVRDGRTGETVAGQAVRAANLDQVMDDRLFANFKRGIHRDGALARQIDGTPWTDKAAGEAFVRALLAALPAEPIDHLVLTTPVVAFEHYLEWLSGLMGAGATDVTVIDESTAAALGYAVTEPNAPVLVFDFGGGTLDLSLVVLPEASAGFGLRWLRRGDSARSAARVIAKAGQVNGGSDIDQWLLTWALAHLELPATALADRGAALAACERAKIALTSLDQAEIAVEAQGERYAVQVTRAQLEGLLAEQGFYDALRHMIDRLMHTAQRSGVYKEDVHYVLMVGGVSLMPSVQAALEAYFGLGVVRADKPFTAVAEGALQVAVGFGLNDTLMQGYGLRHVDRAGAVRFEEILPAGTRCPSPKPIEIDLAAAVDGQTVVELVFAALPLASSNALTLSQQDGQTVLMAQPSGAPDVVDLLNQPGEAALHLQPPGRQGERRVRLRLMIDAARHLLVTATDLKTGRVLLPEKPLVLLRKGGGAVGDGSQAPITGSEPALAEPEAGGQRLSWRRLAAALPTLPGAQVPLEVLEAALRSPSFEARYNAAIALGKRGGHEARAVAALRSADPEVRVKAVEALSNNDARMSIVPVRAALHDRDVDVRYAAVLSLLEMIGAAALEKIASLIRAEVGEAREALLRGVFHACNYLLINPAETAAAEAVFSALEVALTDDDPEARMAAVWVLAKMHHPRADALLLHVFRHDAASAVRAHVVRVAVPLMAECAPTLLAEGVQAADPLVRAQAEQARVSANLPFDESAPRGQGFAKPSRTR